MVIFAKKSLGQNFLIQPQIVADIVAASETQTEETVVEVGPGTGLLTQKLLEIGAFVKAVEKRTGLKIACLEEIALDNKWVSKTEVLNNIKNFKGNYYDYLKNIIKF